MPKYITNSSKETQKLGGLLAKDFKVGRLSAFPVIWVPEKLLLHKDYLRD